MRTQSMKNLVSTFTMVVILSAAPSAFARPAQSRERDGIVTTLRSIIQRMIDVGANILPSTPIPTQSTTQNAPTDPTKKILPSTPIPSE